MASTHWLTPRIAAALSRPRFRARRHGRPPSAPLDVPDATDSPSHDPAPPEPEPHDAIPPAPDLLERDARLFPAAEPFGGAVRDALGPVLFDDGVIELLAHCGTARKVRPTEDWLRETRYLLTGAPTGPRALAGMLEAACTVPEHDAVGPLLTGVAWAACTSGDPVAVLALGTAVRRRSRPSRRQPRWVRAGLRSGG
ncbi:MULTISPECIES: hypothetical protein [Streptomyces]|uniref:hypothetical protein n=1 Tax=Streptomyces TaxID=1883 RepID=UPI0018E05529|nr:MULTISPECIES: hypothetical protein [Streptomyces]MCZ4101208.1 hypothetical protein [Streptomyces sp. H39-C1]